MSSESQITSSLSPNTKYCTSLGVYLFLKQDDDYIYVVDTNNEYIKIPIELWDKINPSELAGSLHNEDVLSPAPPMAVLPASGTTQATSLIQPIMPLGCPSDDDEDDDNKIIVTSLSIGQQKPLSIFEVLSDDYIPPDDIEPTSGNGSVDETKPEHSDLFDSDDKDSDDSDFDASIVDPDKYKGLFDEDPIGFDSVDPQQGSVSHDIEVIDDLQTIHELMSLTGWSPSDEDSEDENLSVVDVFANDDPVSNDDSATNDDADDSPFEYDYSEKIELPDYKIFAYNGPRKKLVVYSDGCERIYRYAEGSFGSFSAFLEVLKRSRPSDIEHMFESECCLITKTSQEKLSKLKGYLVELKDTVGIRGALSEDRKSVYLTGGRLRTRARVSAQELPLYLERAQNGAITSVPSFEWRGVRL